MLNVYLSDTKYCTVQGNLIYSTTNNPCYNQSQIGIGMADEAYTPPSSDNTIINNVLAGNAKNIYYWAGSSGGGLVNTVIAYNTCVNSAVETNLKMGTGSHANTVIANNIFVQNDSRPVAIVLTPQGIRFSHNLWSKTPPSAVAGPGDVTGDPQFFSSGAVAAGQLSANYFRFTSSSIAVGVAEVLPSVNVDFFGVIRAPLPDLGAVQHHVFPHIQPPFNSRPLSSP
jgi:hypothetical protein